ncbi:hypothetical protein GCM10027064_13930 [Microbacterium petrolearium]
MNTPVDSENRPVSRREARQQRRDVEPAPAPRDDDAETTALPAEHDASAADASPDASADRPERSRRRLWIWLTVVVVIVALLVAGGLAAKRLYDQAMGVRAQLESAMTDVAEAQRAVLAGESDAATAAASQLSTKTRAAVAGSSGTLWGLAEAVPFIGDDLAAVRLVAEATDHLAAEVVTPAASISLDTFRPQDGRIDVQAVADLVPLIDRIDAGVNDAVDTLEPIDRSALISQVAGGVKQLDDALSEIQPMIQPVRDVASVLPNALGANGPRNYLLMFQGNSEARSLGGNAAVFTVMRADNGVISTTANITSQDFHNVLAEPVVPLDPEAVNIYGDKIGRYTADFTMVPDFPTAVGILDGWWDREGFPDTSAVVSFDPVALSYILAATGPIELPTGDVLTPENTASLLLNEVYFRYTDPQEQDAFFTATADAVFAKVTSGDFAPPAFFAALGRAVEEGRLMYHSDDPTEMKLVAQTRMHGVMPEDTADRTILGVYPNDNTGSKMSYYLDMGVNSCVSGTSLRGDVTLTSSISPEEAATLPRYISGPYFTPGEISTYVTIYGPQGAELSSITVDGGPAAVLSSGQHLGRPAFKVEVLNRFADSHVVSFEFTGSTELGPVEVWHTPMVRDTEVDSSCE